LELAQRPFIRWLIRAVRRPGIWLLIALFLFITLLQYAQHLEHLDFFTNLTANLGFTRYTVERILYLLPIIWAGFSFGWRGGAITSLAAVASMLPRALFTSPSPQDALVETAAVFIVGNLVSYSIRSLRKGRQITEQLRASEQRYRELFENAHDAILLNDMKGNIVAANRACVRLTGYSLEELGNLRGVDLLSEDTRETAKVIDEQLLRRDASGHLSEVKLVKKNGDVVLVQLASSLVLSNDQPVAFQHVARDVTEEKRMQENLHSLLQQITRAQ